MISKPHVIHERSNIIPIKQNLSSQPNSPNSKGEYSLKQHFFDPSKSSPPNEFMNKLHMRMNMYNVARYTDIKDDSFVSE